MIGLVEEVEDEEQEVCEAIEVLLEAGETDLNQLIIDIKQYR